MRIGTLSERLHVYERLGRCYELLRRWNDAQKAYENLLETAKKADNKEAEWMAFDRLASMSTEVAFDPAKDEKLLRGVRKRAELEADRTDEYKPPERQPAPQGSSLDLTSARDYAEKALRLAQALNRPELVARSAFALANTLALTCLWEKAMEQLGEPLSYYESTGNRVMLAECLGGAANLKTMLGNPKEGVRLGRRSLGMGREFDNEYTAASNSFSMTTALLEVGEYGEAVYTAWEGLKAARSLGHAPQVVINLLAYGDTCRTLYRLDEARTAYQEMVELAVLGEWRAMAQAKLCAVSALEGSWEAAYEYALAAREAREALWLPYPDLHCHHEIDALLSSGDEGLACEDLDQFAERVGENRRFRVAYLRSRAVLDRWDGRAGAAIECLREAEALAGEIGLPGELWQIKASLAELYEQTGDREEARQAVSRAAEVVRQLAAKIEGKELREGFLSAPRVRRVLGR